MIRLGERFERVVRLRNATVEQVKRPSETLVRLAEKLWENSPSLAPSECRLRAFEEKENEF